MSIYDNRETAAYPDFDAPLSYCENQFINNWWTIDHDVALKSLIEIEHWNWPWGISDIIIQITPKETIEEWRKTDPLCNHYSWYNVLMYYSIARAKKLDLLKLIRSPKWKVCQICGCEFIENSIPSPFIKRIGINNLEFCSPCLKNSFLDEGNSKMSKNEMIEYLNELAKLLNKVPSQNYVNEIYNLADLELSFKISILGLLKRKPSLKRVKFFFGSWFNALIKAGILEDGTRRSSMGTQCLAKDGHVCLSLGEKTIDDLLFELNIPHAKEPYYPEGNYRADFLIGDVIIEYFGLIGNVEYDKKVEIKREIAKRYNLSLIEIFPKDLVDTRKLIEKLKGN